MKSRLYTLCTLSDGYHWVEVAEDGTMGAVSDYAFDNERDALIDIEYR